MAQTWDAIVIGAGIIGASVARELATKGFKTLSIDKLPAASYGSTSNSWSASTGRARRCWRTRAGSPPASRPTTRCFGARA